MNFAKDILKAAQRELRALRATFVSRVSARLISKSGLQDRLYITCVRTDGGGAQIQARLSTLLFAKAHGIAFINTEIKGAHFSEGPDWDENWNAIMRFPQSIKDHSEFRTLPIRGPWHFLTSLLWLYYEGAQTSTDARTLFVVEQMHWFTDFRAELFVSEARELRALFQPSIRSRNSEQIVIHLRRGKDPTVPVRFKPDSDVVKIVKGLRREFPRFQIRIYTNEFSSSLQDNLGDLAVLDATANPFEAITHMQAARVLIIAKSSMSYVAGLVSEGVVFSPDFWHPRIPSWRNERELYVE